MANRRYIDFPIASTSGDTDIILIWQDGANKQTTKATFLSGLPENLEDLNDVVISGLTNGQILRYDSVTGKWENTDQGNLDLNDLNDVSIVSPSNGQVLVYNSSTSKWENSSGGYVPYVGAVTTVDLGAQGLRAGYVRFDTTVAGVPNEQGLMFWDADDETVDIILNGYTMKIGEDLFYPVKNQTGSTIAKGVAVRFNGTVGNSGRLLIAPFIADGSVPSSRFMGVTAEEILNGEDGKVLYFGRVRGINTNAFNEGDILYASTTVAGGYQTAIPVAPNNIVQVAAVVTKSATVGTIFVRPTLGSNINKDEGVKIVSVADKNLLQYQSGTSLWENKSLAQVLGGTSAQFVKGDGSLDSSTYGTGTVTSVGLSSATSGVTIGSSPVTTSGTITLTIATASGSQNGLLSSTDWTTFNNKQNALTNPVTGTGTTNYLPKFTGASTIGNSLFTDNGTNGGFGGANYAVGTDVRSFNISAPLYAGLGFWANNVYVADIFGYSVTGNLLINADPTNVFTGTKIGMSIDGTERFAIFSNGNVSIGNSPTDNGAKLQVNGNANFTDNVQSSSFFRSNTPRTDSITIGVSANANYGYIGNDNMWGLRTGTAGDFNIDINNSSSPINAFKIAQNGTSTFNTTSAINSVFNSTNASGGYIGFRRSGTSIGYLGNSAQLGIGVNNALELRADNNLYLTTTSGTLSMLSTGNVGIGTASSGGFLEVSSPNSGNTQMLLVRNFATSATGNFTGNYTAEVRGASNGNVRHAMNIHLNENSSDRRILDITSSIGTVASFLSNGNVLIGTTTDSGNRLRVSGTASFSDNVNAQGFNTSVGTVSAPNSTWVTVYTIPSTQAAEGVYYVYGHYNDDAGGMAFIQVLADRSSQRAINGSNSSVQLQISGRNIQVLQVYGVTLSIQYSVLWQKLR